MERPFDYPGSQSDIWVPSPDHLKRWSGDNPKHIATGETGESFIHITAWKAPDFWSDENICDVVKSDERFEGERCQHDYDCCGRFYARRGRVIDITHEVDEDGEAVKLVIISTAYHQNI